MDTSDQARRLPSEHRSEATRANNPRRSVSPSPSDRTLAYRTQVNNYQSASSDIKANTSSPKLLSSKVNDYWVLEIASCCGSAGALVGIIVFLNAYNGKLSPDWPYGKTVNSILSWLVQIFTALLLEPIAACLSQARWNSLSSAGCRLSDISLYDFASRGAFGCISLIWHSKFRTSACSTCSDLTDSVSASCMDDWCQANRTFCQHSLPDGLTLNVSEYNGRYGNVASRMSSRIGYYNASIIANFSSISVAPGTDLTKATAHHCLVYWCVKTYTAGMRGNKPWEKLVDTWDDLTMPMSIGQNFTFHVPSQGNLTSSKFWVSIPTMKAWMYSKLNINPSLHCNTIETPYDDFRYPMIRHGIPKFCEKLALGITSGVRLYNNTPATGTAWKMETQIHVRWAWVTLPALLVVSTAVFLDITALQTKSGGFDVWKSSPTPLHVYMRPVTGEISFGTLQASYETKEAANYVPSRYDEQDMVQDLPSCRNGSLKSFIVRPSLQLLVMPITHIVLFQFKAGTSPEIIKDICSRMLGLKDNCLHPSSQKPYIRTSSGGIDDSPEGIQHGITHAFVVEFASAADRDYYVKEDPVHQEFVKSLDGVVEKVQAIDFTPGVF
ncbi:hypothetical protein BDV33DRAFT_206775 [Aspergillus novoparasiticus]|uniref:Stress-response A/B barrel domain-containing protein n=1 Tax=Aspergillus novoparasiticus TaxID=986946 RepID=A0A5N6EJM9_9EURO|nr:hypothetical protein BDV33DRAFT_206775 [Aspergillus novoparasiticus]